MSATRWLALGILVGVTACEGRISIPGGGDDDDALPPESRAAQLGDRGCSAALVADVSLRRLTRAQYAHALEDVFGVDVGAPADAFPADAKAGPFDANAGTAISEELVASYLTAAEAVAPTLVDDLDAFFACSLADNGARGCAERFIAEVGRRMYRRPLDAVETDRLLALYDAERARGDHYTALGLVLQVFLQSPSFLYRVELGQTGAGDDALDGYGVASRLSFLLWDSVPDDELLDAAAAGTLSDPDGLEQQLRRMLADPRASRGVSAFFLQWLDLASPESDLDRLMAEETRRFADHVMRDGDGTLAALLTSDTTYLSGELYELYGLPAGGDEWRPVSFAPGERSGILTQPSVLARTSHPDQTSPVLRGKFVRENILCQSLPPPPPNVDATPPDLDPSLTTRERFAQHATDPVCAACHVLMDPIGLGFEGYDASGRRRLEEAGRPVDESGEVVSSWDSDGAFWGVPELADRLAGSLQVHECMVDQWFTYTYGRAPTDADFCALVELDAAFQGAGLSFPELVTAIVRSDAFRHGVVQE